MGRQDMPSGFYQNQLPHHRFIDYSKSQLNYKIRQQKAAGINVKLHQYRGDMPVAQINSDKRLDLLLPNRDQTEKNQKLGQSFKKAKKPELFPVKDEHKNPCSYLRKNHSVLNQRNVSRKTTKSIINVLILHYLLCLGRTLQDLA
jgi:hypothetical protein